MFFFITILLHDYRLDLYCRPCVCSIFEACSYLLNVNCSLEILNFSSNGQPSFLYHFFPSISNLPPSSHIMLSRQSEVLIKHQIGQQVRHASKKSSTKVVANQTTSMRSNLRRFLGPRNFKGFHLKNPFFFPPKGNNTNYISQYPVRPTHRDSKGIDWQKVFSESTAGGSSNSFNSRRGVSPMIPFATNPHTKTAKVVPPRMKADIANDVVDSNMSAQEASFKYGLSVPRIEAIVELEKIRQKWTNEVSLILFYITTSLKDFLFIFLQSTYEAY